MKTSIVLGLLFGDECKGLTISCISKENDLVVRFNGGHQAGHTVEKDGYRHVFSSFGSGTLNGAHTYWSEYCTFYPKSFYNEQRKLIEEGFNPVHFIHPLSMVTTPFDIDYNRDTEDKNKHGSVGMGFGATIARNENTPLKLYAIDLTYRDILIHKLNQIAKYYNAVDVQEQIDTFLFYVDDIELNICHLSDIKNNYTHIVFEGAQGIMLDMDFGFFPNVTRSNTTSKNAIQIIKENGLPLPEIYYCMRSYLTRHGNGFMPNETTSICFEDKTNISHKYQGDFRQGYHSLEMIRYAINCDNSFSNSLKKNVVITCVNQTNEMILVDNDYMNIRDFIHQLGIKNGYVSNSHESIELYKCSNIYSNDATKRNVWLGQKK